MPYIIFNRCRNIWTDNRCRGEEPLLRCCGCVIPPLCDGSSYLKTRLRCDITPECAIIRYVLLGHRSIHNMWRKGIEVGAGVLTQKNRSILSGFDYPIHLDEILVNPNDTNLWADYFQKAYYGHLFLSNMIADGCVSPSQYGPFCTKRVFIPKKFDKCWGILLLECSKNLRIECCLQLVLKYYWFMNFTPKSHKGIYSSLGEFRRRPNKSRDIAGLIL